MDTGKTKRVIEVLPEETPITEPAPQETPVPDREEEKVGA